MVVMVNFGRLRLVPVLEKSAPIGHIPVLWNPEPHVERGGCIVVAPEFRSAVTLPEIKSKTNLWLVYCTFKSIMVIFLSF